MTDFVRYELGEWSALYQDGKLVVVGDSYHSDEYLSQFLNVETRYNGDDVFLGKEAYRENVSLTLEKVEDFEKQKREKELRAQELSEKAKILEAEAQRLRDEVNENY